MTTESEARTRALRLIEESHLSASDEVAEYRCAEVHERYRDDPGPFNWQQVLDMIEGVYDARRPAHRVPNPPATCSYCGACHSGRADQLCPDCVADAVSCWDLRVTR